IFNQRSLPRASVDWRSGVSVDQFARYFSSSLCCSGERLDQSRPAVVSALFAALCCANAGTAAVSSNASSTERTIVISCHLPGQPRPLSASALPSQYRPATSSRARPHLPLPNPRCRETRAARHPAPTPAGWASPGSRLQASPSTPARRPAWLRLPARPVRAPPAGTRSVPGERSSTARPVAVFTLSRGPLVERALVPAFDQVEPLVVGQQLDVLVRRLLARQRVLAPGIGGEQDGDQRRRGHRAARGHEEGAAPKGAPARGDFLECGMPGLI